MCATPARCWGAGGSQDTPGQDLYVAGGQRETLPIYGGAHGSGTPQGNKNALKHGRFRREALAERRLVQSSLQESR